MEQEHRSAGTQSVPDDHAMYARLGFIVMSGKMSAGNVKGEWKKRFAFPRGWQDKTSAEYDKRATGFAVITGARSGVTAIDIDDPDTPTNQRLMSLMAECTLVARTKKGFHYVFRYDARILQTAGDKLDTRNDGGCIFVAPSVAYDGDGRTVAEYRWIRVPQDAEDLTENDERSPADPSGLTAVPEAVIAFLAALDRRYVRSDCKQASPVQALRAPITAPTAPHETQPLRAPTVTVMTAPTVPTAPMAPTAPTDPTAPADSVGADKKRKC